MSGVVGYCRARDWTVITACDEVFQAARKSRVPIRFSRNPGNPFLVHWLYTEQLLAQLVLDGVPLEEMPR